MTDFAGALTDRPAPHAICFDATGRDPHSLAPGALRGIVAPHGRSMTSVCIQSMTYSVMQSMTYSVI